MATQPPADERNDSNSPPPGGQGIAPISIVEEMKTSYLDYAMSVIVSRALPDVREGSSPFTAEFCSPARRQVMSRAGPIANRAGSSVTSWVNITPTAIRPFTMLLPE